MARDTFLIFIPDSLFAPVIATHYDAVVRAIDDLGRYAIVHRITLGDLVRDVTKDFTPSEPDEDADTAFDRECSRADFEHQARMERA